MPQITEEGANRALVRMLNQGGPKELICSLVDDAAACETNRTIGWPAVEEIVKDVAVEISENADWEEVARYIIDGSAESNIDMPEETKQAEKKRGGNEAEAGPSRQHRTDRAADAGG